MLQWEPDALLFPFHVSCVALCCAQVWNASNGHLLNKLEPVDENEVTGIISLPDKSKIITVGWNRKILVYYDDNQVSTASDSKPVDYEPKRCLPLGGPAASKLHTEPVQLYSLFVFSDPTASFENQRNLQISQLSARS